MDRAVAADPRNDERFMTEMELLGALMTAREAAAYHEAAAIVDWSEFNDHFNGRVFAKIGEAVGHGLTNFPLVKWLIDQFEGDATLVEAGHTARAYVARCLALAAPVIGIAGWARQIKHDQLADALRRAMDDDNSEDVEAIASQMDRLKKAHLQSKDGPEAIGKVAESVLFKIQEAMLAGDQPRDFAYAGSRDLANVIGGWRRKRFYVIAGRPGMGKTTTALSLLLKTAERGHGVMIFSLEMGKDELTEIALCDLAWRPDYRVQYRDISASQVMADGFDAKYEHVCRSKHRLEKMPLQIADQAGMTVSQIRSAAHQYAQRLAADGKRLEVICIDHLNLIAATGRYSGNKTAETEEISMSLKQLAKELDVAVISLVQLNRGVEGREDKRPGLSDLRWSGAIEQDADVVMFVFREAYYLERQKKDDMSEEMERQERLGRARNKLELVFGKHRGGPCPVLDMFCDMGCGAVRDMEHRHG
jgi:replicative DNA helicase